MSEIVGYIRVSSSSQSYDAQQLAMEQAGISKVFVETVSGAAAAKPELEKALEYLRPGDTLATFRIDRLGRTLDVITLLSSLKDRGVQYRSLSEGISTEGIYGELVITLIAALATAELSARKDRTAIGREAARARGRVGGRPQKLDAKGKVKLRRLYNSKEFTVKELGEQFGISPATVYRVLDTQKKKS